MAWSKLAGPGQPLVPDLPLEKNLSGRARPRRHDLSPESFRLLIGVARSSGLVDPCDLHTGPIDSLDGAQIGGAVMPRDTLSYFQFFGPVQRSWPQLPRCGVGISEGLSEMNFTLEFPQRLDASNDYGASQVLFFS
jgi:hypothetical protein